jgi:hypothetical protein
MDNHEKINAIMTSLDGMEQAAPGPFFYTRVRARMQQENTTALSGLVAFFSRPVVAMSVLALIFLMNTAAFLYQKEKNGRPSEKAEQSLADDYNTTLATNSYYVENTDPQ